jgi:hypothetical protein
VQPDSVKIVYPASFLKGTNQTIDFGKTIFANGKLYAATVRTDQTNISGNGKIAEIWLKLKSVLPANSSIQLSASDAIMISSSGVMTTLGAALPVNLQIVDATGLNKISGLIPSIRCFPNPAHDNLILQNGISGSTGYSITDITGRELLNGEFEGSITLNISNLHNGTYFIRFAGASGQSATKIVVTR